MTGVDGAGHRIARRHPEDPCKGERCAEPVNDEGANTTDGDHHGVEDKWHTRQPDRGCEVLQERTPYEHRSQQTHEDGPDDQPHVGQDIGAGHSDGSMALH